MRALKNSDERDSSRYDWKSLVFVQKEKKKFGETTDYTFDFYSVGNRFKTSWPL